MDRGLGRIDWLARLVVLLALAGCGGGANTTPQLDHVRVRAMTDMYGVYLAEHKNQAPPNEQAFRDFLGTKHELLERLGLSVDQMFIAPHSGGPLVWIYGSKPRRGQGGQQFIAYEQSPVDGKRLVIAPRGMYEEMDEARFRTMFPNAK